jgi:uncharacterized protein YjbI with pentapeptide repeats
LNKRKPSTKREFQRDPADLPREPEESDGTGLAGPEIEIEEVLVRGVRVAQSAVRNFRAEAVLFQTVAMPGICIRQAQWKDLRFEDCDLSNLEVRLLTAVRVELVGCRMTGMRAGESDFQDLLVSAGDQRYAQFRMSKFKNCEFDGCDFEDADFYGADLSGCVFRKCNLRNAEMSRSKLVGTDLRGSNIDGLRVTVEDVAGAIVDAAQALALAPLLGIRIL